MRRWVTTNPTCAACDKPRFGSGTSPVLALTTLAPLAVTLSRPSVEPGLLVSVSWNMYARRPPKHAPDLVVIRATGERVRLLTRTVERESEPAWSPDGARIAFVLAPTRAPTGQGGSRGVGARSVLARARESAFSQGFGQPDDPQAPLHPLAQGGDGRGGRAALDDPDPLGPALGMARLTQTGLADAARRPAH
jgi:hypothetical protein